MDLFEIAPQGAIPLPKGRLGFILEVVTKTCLEFGAKKEPF